MTLRHMERRAADNTYLHPDFHCALNCGITYLADTFGRDAVIEYLERFARQFYAPLTQALCNQGLQALREHIEAIYAAEATPVEITQTEDTLLVQLPWCPAVKHMRRKGVPVSPLFVETTRTVNEAICSGTPFRAELLDYDNDSGASIQRFTRRSA